MEGFMSAGSINNVQAIFASTFNGVRSGTVTDAKNGAGTFSTTVSHAAGQVTIDETINYADGKTVTHNTTIVKNADGTYGETTQTTRADGKTTTSQETITVNADGSETVAGTFTAASGKVDNLAGTVNGNTANYTLTNPAGKTETRTRQNSVSNGTNTATYSGTNFAGVSFSDTMIRTLLSKQES
jgi:hypothetical protein